MGFSLAELRKAVPGSGIDQPPGIDVLGLLGEAGAGEAEANGLIRASQPQPAPEAGEAQPGR
jgi:hypothetical protein